ncbi:MULTISPECIES: hypothetical protein [unclassified Kitasatospora]|uniref:SCO2583/SCO2584 N-terminal domain-containing protein n=1 Tax=unclassified Kitasatospora TaxID=2633591 RepID=UPI00070A3081|nr:MULTISPECIES: hypothetical protein [unclassified Kitasatospora]KQV18661.1 hypothetical protein ASC99_05455 [Kitasatospora sp. Root107]KRB74643.1 hypothetical protein ASE03_19390 [Kitasatospora sp. Root187]
MPTAEDPQQRPTDDPFEGLVLDEDFIRAAETKEQSGRTRMLAARWKDTPPVDPGGRRSVNDGPKPKRRFGRKPKPVDPWGNVRRPKRNWQAPVFVLLAVGVALAALNIEDLRNWNAARRGTDSADAAPRTVPTVGPETAKPSAAPPPVDDQQPTVARPWAGSPAEGWPAGPDAIVLPQATAVGVFDEEQVAAQLKLVKDFLVAANLDPAVIAAGRPEAALTLLDRQAREQAVTALDHPSAELEGTWMFSRFNLRDAIPATDTVKVQGRTSFEGDGEKGVLVHTDYTFVYALRPGSGAAPVAGATAAPTTWTARTVVRRVITFRFYNPKTYKVDPKKISFEKTESSAGNSACNIDDGFYHPQFDQLAFGSSPEPLQTGPTTDPYDRSGALRTTGGCGTVSRS